MVKSMTGYGKGEAKSPLGTAKAEIKTLNHRYFEFSARLPENFSVLEEKIRDMVQGRIRRGRANVVLIFERKTKPQDELVIDNQLARRYKTLLLGLKRTLKLGGELRLEQLLTFPGIITTKPREENLAKLWPTVKEALSDALEETVRSREKEGRALNKDLTTNARIIERSLRRVKNRSPLVVKRYRKRLLTALKRPRANPAILERLEEDVAIFAKSCDISEEVTRMHAHIKSFEETLGGAETGRKLDFIAQELHREANTIGSKASDYEIQKEVIKIKGAIEKIREQVQNVE